MSGFKLMAELGIFSHAPGGDGRLGVETEQGEVISYAIPSKPKDVNKKPSIAGLPLLFFGYSGSNCR